MGMRKHSTPLVGSSHKLYDIIKGSSSIGPGLLELGLDLNDVGILFVDSLYTLPRRYRIPRGVTSESALRRFQSQCIAYVRSQLFTAGRDKERGLLVVPSKLPALPDYNYHQDSLEHALLKADYSPHDIAQRVLEGARKYKQEYSDGPDKRFLEYRRVFSQL
ncbi:hypothetical protein D6774_02215 [Candidatus Woesearchaeota archaeon]|nr:MAG: hypothetical protein D6774_02215 [Candidatus Woesearchaeota archaeon]